MATEVIMPRLGEGVIEGLIAKWLKQEGETVGQYEPLLEIETDKVTTEATAETAGTVLRILVPEGATVAVGTVLAYLGQPGETLPGDLATPAGAPPTAAPAPAARTHTNGGHTALPEVPAGQASRQAFPTRVSPVVARMAAEHAIDLSQIDGTGRGGRITKNDVLAYLENRTVAAPALAPPAVVGPPPAATRLAAAPSPAPAASPGDLIPHSNMRRAIAEHMVMSKHTSPHVTTVFEVDFSAVTAHRRAHKASFANDGANLTFTAYIVAALVQALKRHPRVNSTWRDDGLLLKREINIGMATAIETGLIVPVIKNADSLNLLGLARTINDLANRARQNQLRPDDVQGGTFTLTNHGTSGSLFATPIINQPQCGILGVGQIQKRVVVIEDMIAIRPMSYVSFTFDHRILDGASADYFVASFKEVIERWQ